MVEVFKTNVFEHNRAGELTTVLRQHFPGSKINFDLEDCDKILRVEGDNFLPHDIARLLQSQGCVCEALD